jgi:hypothetical protein
MATHQLAKGLASLGRHGDSMLMHVSPSEVAGLQQLGNMTGHKLHTNPHTGMPEAFDFGDFFTNLLPMAAGILLAPGTGGASLVASSLGETAAAAAPVVAGMATGAAVAGAKGEDALMGGLMGGLGGYGGGNIGGSLGKMGAAGGYDAGSAAAKSLVGPQFNATTGLSSAGIPGPSMMTTLANQTAPTTFAEGMGNIGSGLKQLASDPMGKGYDAFKAAGGSGTQLATSIGIPALDAMQPKPVDTTDEEAKRKAEENKYKDKLTGSLNPYQARPDFGTMLMATGGTVGSNQSTIASGGLQDLYGSNDNTTGAALSKDGYGIGRLANLAAQGSIAKAQDTFYADGGPIAFADGGIFELEAAKGGYLNGAGDGMSDSIPGTIEGKQPARLADGEFVIPADVVSHLGNGSSKAGSKRLYDMMHKVRKARTGNPKQGKEINPNQYMPA